MQNPLSLNFYHHVENHQTNKQNTTYVLESTWKEISNGIYNIFYDLSFLFLTTNFKLIK